ncbi:hypothetical protein P9112_010454 [Eukaryota sp. TZLM1-RC]
MTLNQGCHHCRDSPTPSCSQMERHCQYYTNPPLDSLPNAPEILQSSESINASPQTRCADVHRATLSEFSDLSLIRQESSHSRHFLIPPIDRDLGVQSISVSEEHSLLLTYSGEVYAWGDNDYGLVLHNGSSSINFPIKLPLTNIVSISAGRNHSLALSSQGKLYGWGSTGCNQINMSEKWSLPITLINIPYNIKEVFGGDNCSFALTQEGQVVKWGDYKSFKLIEELNNIVFVSVFGDSFIAVDEETAFFCWDGEHLTKISVSKHLTPRIPLKARVLLDGDYLFLIDVNGDVWKLKEVQRSLFDIKPTKLQGLSKIDSIIGFKGTLAAIDNNGKVFVWGELNKISDVYEDAQEPICVEAFTNIEGISVGHNIIFAYNKSTVWAWGRNNKGQLGTGDLIDRPQPVKVFGSEILGSFQYPKQPLDRIFSGLIKLIYFEYLQHLKNLFGNHAYTKARFNTKCIISKKVAQFAKEVVSCFEFLKDPRDLNSNENICDLQLRLSTVYNGPNVINTRIQKLDVYYDGVDYDPQLLSFFPNVEVVKLCGWSKFGRSSINLAHLSLLKCLELDYRFNVEQLPTSLVKLVLIHDIIEVTDLSYLTSLKELVVISRCVSRAILEGQIPIPQSIVRVEAELFSSVNVEIQLPNLKELVIHWSLPTNITEQNFPFLKFLQLIKPDKESLANSELFPSYLISKGFVESVQLVKNQYLVKLPQFPWLIQYPSERYLIDIFRGQLGEK